MSMTEDEARYEEAMEALYNEHKEIAIEEFIEERLQSYFISHPDIIQNSIFALQESKNLLKNHPTSAFIFSSIAIEVVLKLSIIKPFVYGVVHSESVASIVTDMVIKQPGIDRFSKFLFQAVKDFCGVDFKNYKRKNSKIALWEEMNGVQQKRNLIMHNASFVSADDAEFALTIAKCLLESVFPMIIEKVGFHIHSDCILCNKFYCKTERFEFSN